MDPLERRMLLLILVLGILAIFVWAASLLARDEP